MIEDGLRNEFWRAVIKPMYEIKAENDDYQLSGSIVVRALGSIQIGITSFNSQRYTRTRKLIAEGGLDHYVLQLITGGNLNGDFNGVDVEAKQGDIVVIDLSQTVESRVSSGSRITVVIPREELERTVGWRNLHGLVMPADAPMTCLLFSYLRNLRSVSGVLDRAEAQAALDAMFMLLGAGINGAEGGVIESLPANLPIRKRILAYIDEKLSDPLLGPHSITQNLRISRSGLYRTFERMAAWPELFATSGWIAPVAFWPMNGGGIFHPRKLPIVADFMTGHSLPRHSRPVSVCRPKRPGHLPRLCWRQMLTISAARPAVREMPSSAAF